MGILWKKINPAGSKTIYADGIYEVEQSSDGSVTQTTVYRPAGGARLFGNQKHNISCTLKTADFALY